MVSNAQIGKLEEPPYPCYYTASVGYRGINMLVRLAASTPAGVSERSGVKKVPQHQGSTGVETLLPPRWLCNVKFSHSRTERAWVDVKELCCPVFTFYFPSGLYKYAEDIIMLYLRKTFTLRYSMICTVRCLKFICQMERRIRAYDH